MPKEILVRKEYHGQVWFDPQPVAEVQDTRVTLPTHLDKGVRTSPSQKDSFNEGEQE